MSLPLPDANGWRQAEIKEYRSHMKNATIGPPTHLPPGFKPKCAGWTYKIKRDGVKKARVVIRGYLLMPGIDYNETHAPVIKLAVLRSLLAHACRKGWTITQADIETAFLAANMDTEVYVTTPPAWNETPTLDQPNTTSKTTHRLLKAIPGVPQGSRLHHTNFKNAMKEAGLTPTPDDHCLYKHIKFELFCAVWVDDFIMAHSQELKWLYEKTMAILQLRFSITAIGPLDDLLSVQIMYDPIGRSMSLSQRPFTERLLKRAGMENSNAVSTPMPAATRLTKADCPQTPAETDDLREEATWYRSNTASCLYLSMWTRPDISFAVNKLAKFMHNPGTAHITLLKHLLRYLNGTQDKGLVYQFCPEEEIENEDQCTHVPRAGLYGLYDASFADDPDTRKSTTGFIYYYYGAVISWQSKLHPFVTTATNHSEYCASATAAREARFLGKIFERLGENPYPIALFSDSMGAVAMNTNPVLHKASKHVEIADHYARELVARGLITIQWISNKEMDADAFTKPLARQLFDKFTSRFIADIKPN